MMRRPPRSTLSSSSAASDVYKRQLLGAGFSVPRRDDVRLEGVGHRRVHQHGVDVGHRADGVQVHRRPLLGHRYGEHRPCHASGEGLQCKGLHSLSLIHISEPTRLLSISYAVFCLPTRLLSISYAVFCLTTKILSNSYTVF